MIQKSIAQLLKTVQEAPQNSASLSKNYQPDIDKPKFMKKWGVSLSYIVGQHQLKCYPASMTCGKLISCQSANKSKWMGEKFA